MSERKGKQQICWNSPWGCRDRTQMCSTSSVFDYWTSREKKGISLCLPLIALPTQSWKLLSIWEFGETQIKNIVWDDRNHILVEFSEVEYSFSAFSENLRRIIQKNIYRKAAFIKKHYICITCQTIYTLYVVLIEDTRHFKLWSFLQTFQ